MPPQKSTGPIINIREDIRRLSNLLLVGHGGALLVIFNARASNPALSLDGLRDVAWWFALGLMAAFWMSYLSFQYDYFAASPLSGEESQEARRKSQYERWGWTQGAFFASAGAFLIGLIVAINMLPGAPAAAASAHERTQLDAEHAR